MPSNGWRILAARLRFRSNEFLRSGWLIAILCPLAGCIASNQTGPIRPITIDDDVSMIRPLAEPDLAVFYSATSANQAAIRNQVITARMYIADMEYNHYEARLTKEIQDEGLAATAINLGLTGSAALIPVASTDRILAGIATGLTGLDKAYSEKELLNNTIQALQTQMRADRKAQAATIYSKMFLVAGNSSTVTPIDQYTLPMALSDADRYYQAGTMASALIGLTKTVTNADQNADLAKDQAGPNSAQVVLAKATASPLPGNKVTVVTSPQQRLTSSRDPVVPAPPVVDPIATSLTATERKAIGSSRVPAFMAALCVTSAAPLNDFGPLNSAQRIAIAKFKAGFESTVTTPPTDDTFRDNKQAQSILNFRELQKLEQAVSVASKQDPSTRCGADAAFKLGQSVK